MANPSASAQSLGNGLWIVYVDGKSYGPFVGTERSAIHAGWDAHAQSKRDELAPIVDALLPCCLEVLRGDKRTFYRNHSDSAIAAALCDLGLFRRVAYSHKAGSKYELTEAGREVLALI